MGFLGVKLLEKRQLPLLFAALTCPSA